MTAEEFWDGDPRLAEAYRRAEEMRRENRCLDEWRAGRYVYEALLSASPAFRELSRGIDHPYPAEPVFSTPEGARRAREKRERERFEAMRARFEAMANGVNERMRATEERP